MIYKLKIYPVFRKNGELALFILKIINIDLI